jgi:hypothetical protein
MPKVGRFVTDPRAGAYCQITLDSGEKVIVNHEKGGFKGGLLTIEISRASVPIASSRATWIVQAARAYSLG